MAGLGGWIIAEIVYLSFISIVGTIGNLLIILAVLTTPSLRQRTNFFIFVLAICDLCTSCILIPFFILCLGFGGWPFRNESWCVFLGYITLWCLGWSVTTLALIAANRYLSVTRPKFTYYKLCSNLSLALSCFGQVALGVLVIMLPTFLGLGSVGFNSVLGHCSYTYSTFKEWIYVLVLFLGGVVSTGIVIPAYYALTFYIFRKTHHNVRTSLQRSVSSSDLSSRKRGRFVISRDEIRLTKKAGTTVCHIPVLLAPLFHGSFLGQQYVHSSACPACH